MAFPQSWNGSGGSNGCGLLITKTGEHPTAQTVIADVCIPAKHIILSASACALPADFGSSPPPLGVRIDSNSGVPNASRRPLLTETHSFSSDAFLDEVGVSRSSLRRLQVTSITSPIYYFEITPVSELESTDETRGVAIGLSSVDNVQTYGDNQCPLSIGYHSSGRFIHEESFSVPNEAGFGTHDVVGCGLEIGGKGRVFFTCNGHVIGTPVFSGFGIQGEAYYPVVILQGKGTSVKTNFGASEFQFQPHGMKICNYAFSFQNSDIGRSRNSCAVGVGSYHPDALIDAGDNSSRARPMWGTNDISTIQSTLLMFEQIIKAQENKDRSLGRVRDTLESQEYLDTCQDVFHLKIQRALSSGLKTISDLVQNDGLANEMQLRVGSPTQFGLGVSSGSDSSTPCGGERKRPVRKVSKSTAETVMMIAESLLPVWQKMLDLISQSFAAPPSLDLNLSSLLALNDRITSTITEVESVLSITLPRAVNKAVVESGDSCTQRRDRGFTEPAINTSSSIFTWPARLSINVSGGYSSSEAKESPVGSDNFIGDLSVSHFSDLDSLTSTGESCLAQRDRGTSSIGSDFFPRTALSRQGTRTQMPLPSLHELMTSLRRGSAEDVAKVADLIYYLFSDMAGYRRRSNSTSPMLQNGRFGLNQVHCRLIKSIVEQGGLLVLLQALARCTEWPEVEIKVSRAVTVLTTCETDFHMLMRKSNEILTAMNLLLLKGGVVLAESNAKSSLISLDDDDCLPLDRQDSAVHIDHSLFRELVAMAVGNICSVIQSHWEKETLDIETSVGSAMADSSPKSDSSGSSTNRFDRFTSRSKVVVEQIPSGGRSKHLDGRAPSFGNAQSLTRCVESVLCIITMLIKPPSLEESDFSINPLPHFFSKTAVLCCQAVCCLTQVSPLKQVVVEKRGRDEGILDLLVSWVNICADVVSTSKNEMGSLRAIEFGDLHSMPLEHRNPLLFELIESVACAISNLCKIDRRSQLFAGHSDFDMLGTSEYAVGVIDAQMKAVSVPAAIVKFVKAVTPDAFSEPRMGEHFPIPAVKDRGESMESITSRNSLTSSNNEREYSCDDKMSILLPFPIEVPSWCSTALMQSTLVHFAEALSSMTCRQTNRAPIITSALCSIMVTAAAQTTRHRRTRLNLEHPTEEYGPEKLQQMRQRELEEDAHLGKCALACLNGLCSFVSDALNAVSPLLPSGMSRESQKKKQRGEEALPEVVREIVSFNVLDTLKLVATLQICEARLSAFRLLSMVSDWPLALEKMVNLNITEILVSFVKDVEDANEWYIKPSSGPMAPSPTGVERLVPSKPKKERGISTDTVKSSYSEDAPSAISGSAPLALEELMRVLYFISQVCEHSFQNAARLYDEGLMRVMLNLIKHNKTNVEVHRQALRSISAMCPVLSSITPGGHPAQVIEKLTSAKDNAEMHMVQNSGKNIERRESAKMRLEFNLLIFVEALRALAHALLSPSTLVQKEALRGISLLAVDDQLRVGIVEGPLKQVIRIFVEPSTEQDIKDLAEQVFVNIGFHNGSKDLEIVANDSELLSDWFYMKRSMRPQALAYDLTRHWIDALFYGDVMAERRARKQFMLAELGHVSNHISDEADSLSIRLPGGLAIDLRDTLDLPGLDVLKGMLEKLVSLQLSEVRPSGGLYLKSTVGSSAGHSELRDALHQQFVFLFDSWQMLNQMYFADHMASEHHVQSSASMLHSPYYDMLPAAVSRQKSSPSANLLGNGQAKKKKYGVSLFSDTFFRYINHCSSKLSAQKIIADEENERLERELEAERALMGPLSAISSDIAFNSPSFHATKGVLIHTPTKNPEVRPIRKRQTSNVGVMDGAENLVQLHEPLAARVVELFDFIFPSKMLQLYLLDLVSCGLSFRNGDEDFSTPSPRQFRALLLPPREYPTFHREGRIIERIFDDIRTRGYQSEKPTFNYAANVLSFGSDTSNSSMGGGTYKNTSYQPNAVLWAVCFRDSKFENEFFGTFSNTLHKCPSIAILNFVMQTPKMDSRLGYLAGNVPPTIRFLVFENALSSDSLQIMCVLLRTQNAAWQKGGIDNSARISKSTSRNRKDSNPAADRGLYGLTIRLHNLSDDDIQLIVELLDPSGESNKSAGLPSDFSIYKSPAQISKSVAIPTVTATVIKDGTTQANEPAAFPTNDDGYPMNTRGLKYLDLSDNRLSDAQCGDVLKAAAFGPLEGLELGGNLIQRGLYFSDSLLLSLSHPHNVLKHLGVSFCGLSQKCFVKILQCIAHALNPSLTSLDCSSNSLIHSAEVKEAIHDLLKKNRTLRIIDLSRNSFSNDTIRAINLGLLENESTVLILEISLNSTMKAQELAYVREKLWRNRELYAAQRAAANSCYRHSSMDGGHHDTSSLDFGADLMRERNTMDLSDVVPHSFSAIQISRESSVSSTLSAGVAAGDSLLSPVRRSVSGVLPNMSRTSSKDSSSAEVTPSSVSKLGPKLPSDSILNRSVSNPFITISDFGGRRRSGTGVSSRQEALDAVSRFAEDGSKLNVDLNGIAFRSANGDLAPSFDGILEPYDPTAVQAVRVENAYPVTSVVDAMVMPEEAIVLGTDNETADTDDKDGLMESMMGQKHADDVVSKSTRSMFSEVSYPDGISRELWVLFSAPLAWRDAETGVLRPIEMLNYKNEKDTLWQVFREGQRDIDLHFNFATTDQLRTAVTLGCKALHFSGHGHPEWLNFEDGRSGLQIVTVDRLEKLCSAGGIKLDFVFVSACYSRKAGEAFAAAGVKHVVCVSVDAQLLDTAATIFTRAFYLALVVGENVDKAFEIGQNAVAASPSVPSSMKEHDKFLLLPQDKPHNVPIFRAPSLPSWPPENSAAMRWEDRLTPDYLPEPPEDFEGREVDMYEVITALHKRHLVSIIGERGLGKSAVAVASMRYLTERNVFEHGAVYVRLQQVTTYAGFLTTFQRILTTTCPAAAEKLHQLSSANRVDDSGGASGDTSAYRYKRDPLFTQEDLLISCVSSLKLLIVFDHANNVLTTGEVGSDVTMFLGNLLEGRRNIRILITSTVGVGIINGFGVVEKCIKLGPLTLYNSLRLFARLTPALVTAKQRFKFIQSLTPKLLEGDCCENTSAIVDHLPEAKKIMGLLGNGHPDKIVKLAVESDTESVITLQTTGLSFILSAASSRNQSELTTSSRALFQGGDLTIQAVSSTENGSPLKTIPAIPLSVGPTIESTTISHVSATRTTSQKVLTTISAFEQLGISAAADPSPVNFSPPPVFVMSATAGPTINPFEYYENDVTPASPAGAPISLVIERKQLS